jgi:L-amino acid N-acyltransferase YncA
MATPDTRPQLSVRPAQESDAATLREIFNEAVEDGLVTFETAPRSLEEQQLLIAAAEKDARHPILVAEVRNWTCGVATLEPHDPRHGLDDMAEVQIFVRRSFRRYGVGRQLMRALQAEATRQGYRKLIGLVLSESQDTLRLCQATGWRIVGQHQQHARHDPRLRDVTIVEFHLAADPASRQ